MPEAQSFKPEKSSPLDGLPGVHGGIRLEERRFVGKVNLRGGADDTGFVEAVTTVIGCAPPIEPNTVSTTTDVTVFWLGPDEWQIHCAEDAQHELISDLRNRMNGRHAAVVDVSDYYVVMRLSGSRVFEILSKAVSFDLHPRAFPTGACAQTVFGHATVLLHKVDDAVVDLQVRWTFAEYVWSFIVDGTLEYRGTSA